MTAQKKRPFHVVRKVGGRFIEFTENKSLVRSTSTITQGRFLPRGREVQCRGGKKGKKSIPAYGEYPGAPSEPKKRLDEGNAHKKNARRPAVRGQRRFQTTLSRKTAFRKVKPIGPQRKKKRKRRKKRLNRPFATGARSKKNISAPYREGKSLERRFLHLVEGRTKKENGDWHAKRKGRTNSLFRQKSR